MNIMVIGAHPDDPEVSLGGVIALYAQAGHDVTMVSVTNGNSGHQTMNREELAVRRKKEAERSAGILGAKYVIMDIDDGALMPTLENRLELIKLIRKCDPDIIFTHPLIDYHPDHRYTAQLVMDSSFMLKVPLVAPDAPPMTKDPVILFYRYRTFDDDLKPFVCVPVDSVNDKKILALHQHESQMYEWLPWVDNYSEPVPDGNEERLDYTARHRNKVYHENAVEFRGLLVDRYGAKGERIQYAEVLYKCPIGKQIGEDELDTYFPFIDDGIQKNANERK